MTDSLYITDGNGYRVEPEWLCDYCDSRHANRSRTCPGCGNPDLRAVPPRWYAEATNWCGPPTAEEVMRAFQNVVRGSPPSGHGSADDGILLATRGTNGEDVPVHESWYLLFEEWHVSLRHPIRWWLGVVRGVRHRLRAGLPVFWVDVTESRTR